MVLTEKQIADLKIMALAGYANSQIASVLSVDLSTVHAARSHLGYTIPKVAEMETVPCDCCGSPVPLDAENEYTMPDGITTSYLCARCQLTVDYVNSFYDGTDENEEDNNAVQNN